MPLKITLEELSEDSEMEENENVVENIPVYKKSTRGVKIIMLNDLDPRLDNEVNGEMYSKETKDTAVVYQILNIETGKSYIGSAYSYEKHGQQNPTKYGAKGRFRRHWSNKSNPKASSECPVFYEALQKSDLYDWYIMTLAVCSKKHMKEYETRFIRKYKTGNPKYGYNYFVGVKKPENSKYLAQYKSNKAKTNANRAIGGKLKREKHSKNLPPNINYRISKKRDGTVCGEGYFVQIKINGKLYNKAFLSMRETMEDKLNKAIKQLEEFKKRANKPTGKNSKTIKKSVGKRN